VKKRCELQDLPLEELQAFSPAFGPDIYQHLKIEAVLACHDVAGGTAPRQVEKALRTAREQLSAMQEAHAAHA
jgi:argininosuccinate lyase